ncbi:MAG: phosphodiester glycosidase family protein [Verrucomicrobiaceae bacterium]|nr:phosphodiester glycosidase family protein [Verrucomicrobiaceae bacterium]
MALLLVLGFAAWRLELFAQPLELGNGARYGPRRVGGVMLHLVFFDESKVTLRVLSNPGRGSEKQLDDWGREQKALAVCNGGYFDLSDRSPSGLEIADGVRSGAFVNRGADGGSFIVRDGKAALVWDTEFRDDPKITAMVQCSPWLVSEGRPWTPPQPSDKPEPKNARTFILTDGAGHWAIGTAQNVGLVELAGILASPGAIPDFSVKRALNLDGGPSTGMWFKTADGRENLDKPGWIVRNGIAVMPRGSQ